jgi:methyl-accepting chemotaxis protein
MRDIGKTVQSAADFTRRVSDQIQEVKDTATQTGQAADGVLQASADLAQQTDRLKSEVSGFLSAVHSGTTREETELNMGERRVAV